MKGKKEKYAINWGQRLNRETKRKKGDLKRKEEKMNIQEPVVRPSGVRRN